MRVRRGLSQNSGVQSRDECLIWEAVKYEKYIALYAVNSPTRFNGGISRSFVLKEKNLWCKTRIRSVCPCTADFPISHNSWLRENIVLAPCNVFLQRFVGKKKMYRPFLNKQVCARADERETPAATRRPKGFTTVVICGHVWCLAKERTPDSAPPRLRDKRTAQSNKF